MSTSPRPTRREQQAGETRRLILDAALELFARQGYAATSIADVAEAAGVAVPTVYASVGPKPAIVAMLNDRIDDAAQLAPVIEALLASEDAAEVLRLSVRITRQVSEHAGDLVAALRSASSAGPELAGAYEAGMARHRAGTQATANRLASLGALPPAVSPQTAAAILDVLLAPDSWASLTQVHQLSWTEAEALLLSVASRSVLSTAQGHRRASRGD